MASRKRIYLVVDADDDKEESEEELEEEDDNDLADAPDSEESEEEDESERPQALRELYNIISKLKSPGTFACGGTLPSMYPGLRINGYGDVSLPLRDQDAQQIISLCNRAPFGRGEQTIVDTTVRNTWQLSPSEVQIANKEFVQQINALVSNTIAIELGLGTSSTIGAQLYKVLLYEPGGFFVPHKDTEKQVGMFGSLVVTLPSTFSGGALVVHHQDMSHTFTVDNPSFNMSYVAFFADCKHEIKPVTSGYRLALVYNLVSLDKGPLPSPSSNESIRAAAKRIQKWRQSASNTRFVFILQHQYTPSGLSFQVLKNKDRAVVQMLLEALKETPDLELTLALLNYSKYGGGSSKYDIDYEDAEAKIGSLINSNGEKFDIDIPISLEDFYPTDAFENSDYDESSVEEATGNEGATATLRYHRAVALVWPKPDWLNLICGCKQPSAVAHLTRRLSKCSVMEERDSSDWQQCKQIATLIIEKHAELELDAGFLLALAKIGDFNLVQKYFKQIAKKHGWKTDDKEQQFYEALESCIAQFGWDPLQPLVEHVFYTLNYSQSMFLHHFAEGFAYRDPQMQSWMQLFIRKYADEILSHFGYFDGERNAIDLVGLACTIDWSLLTEIFTKLKKNLSDVDTQLIPLLKKLHEKVPQVSRSDDYAHLVKKCMKKLQQRITKSLAVQDTWAFNSFKPCREYCSDCSDLKGFMFSATQKEFKKKAPTKIHEHLREHLTELYPGLFNFAQEGKYPYTFVATKIGRELEGAQKKAAKDTATMKQLEDLLEKDPEQRANKRRKVTHDTA